MPDNYPYDTDFVSEIPVNLPANRLDPEYGSDVMVELLAHMGVDYIMLTPGSSFRGIHDSLVNFGRNHKPELILCAHEEIAAAMAHGYAKASGRTGVVILHDLVGVQHALMSFYNAWSDQQPMLVLGGSGPMDPAERRAIDWLHSANSQSEAIRPYSKWTDEPATLQAVLDSVMRAWRITASSPRAPTYVSIDTGIQEARVSADDYRMPDTSLARYQPAPPIAAPAEAVAAAAEILTEAECPLVFGGRLGADARATAPMTALVELTGAAYKDGQDIVCLATAHPHNLTGGYGETGETEILGEADTVLAVDCNDVTAVLGGYAKARGGWDAKGGGNGGKAPPKLIDLSLNDFKVDHWSNISGPLSPVEVQLLADPLHGLGQLVAELERRAAGDPPWRKRAIERSAALAVRHEALRARQSEAIKIHWDDRPVSVARMMHELWEVVKGRDWLLLLRNGRSWYENIWQFDGAGQFLGNNGGGGVGYGPGGVLGSALAARDRGKFPVAILGDGDFTMGPGALWTAAHYRIPLLIVLHNNTSFGNDEEHQVTLAEQRGRPVENAWIGQRMEGPSPDYATIARGYGAKGVGPVTSPDHLAEAYREAAAEVDGGGVAVVDVRTALK